MKNLFLVFGLLIISTSAFADSKYVNRNSIMTKIYKCSNGGKIEMLDTRYGNVKKVVFTKENEPRQYGYVSFWNMTDHYEGNVYTSMTSPDPATGDSPQYGKNFSDMTIEYDGTGLLLTIIPVRTTHSQYGFTCINY